MEVVTGSERLPPGTLERAVAIGNFDGVHLGHRQVLSRLAEAARARGLPAWVFTFDPAPTVVVAPDRHQPRLVTLAYKLELLDALGIAGVVVEPFTRAFASQSAGDFARGVLRDRLSARALVVGWDFRFGAGRDGDADALRRAIPDLPVEQVAPFLHAGSPVSSSRIRRLISAGEVEGAAVLLGRPHRLTGIVVHGDARGRTIGVPTANLRSEVECLPASGVYAARATARGLDGRSAVLNIGMRPTFHGTELRVEAHVLDWEGDLYGERLDLDLVARVRGEERFASVDALVAQIRADIAFTRALG